MCLDLRKDSKKPFAPFKTGVSTIRYKVVVKTKYVRGYTGPYRDYRYKLNKWLTGNVKLLPSYAGFHVFVDKDSAKELAESKTTAIGSYRKYYIATVRVRGFLRSGKFNGWSLPGRKSETWKEMKIIKLEEV